MHRNSAKNTTSIIEKSTDHYAKMGNDINLSVSDMIVTVNTNLKLSGYFYNNSGYALDCPNSYHISRYGATKVRTFVLDPSMMLVDSSQS